MWWSELLTLAMLAMAGGYPCCCVTAPRECTRCINDDAPEEFEVVISGSANEACLACSWDGTYILGYASDCNYSYTLTSGEAGNISVHRSTICVTGYTGGLVLSLSGSGSSFGLGVTASINSDPSLESVESHRFLHTQTTKYDCLNLSSLTIPYISRIEGGFNQNGIYGCDLRSATVTVSTVPP